MQSDKLFKSFFIFFILCFMVVPHVIGQIGPPENPAGDPDAVPITGLEVLLGAGALLGVKRLLGKKKEQNIQ